jgi:hypothetical protein
MREDFADTRVLLLSKLEQNQYLGAPLRYLNGILIEVSERIRALENAHIFGFGETRMRTFRTELALEAVKAQEKATQIMLNGFGIKVITPITVYLNLEFLDLSDNEVETLADQGLEALPKL